jgi:hypothetical protein
VRGKDIAIRSSISAGSACKMLPILALVRLNIAVILAFYAGFRLMALASLRHNEDPVTTKLATLVRTGGRRQSGWSWSWCWILILSWN